MATVKMLFQGLNSSDNHADEVNNLLNLPNMDYFIFSIAFARKSGINEIESNLITNKDKLKVFLGIRNNVTSIQAIVQLLNIGIKPFVVDTGVSTKIFHPKIYLGYNDTTANLILGSSNLTSNGLNINIEASSLICLDRSNADDESYFQKLSTTYHKLETSFPDNVFQVNSIKDAVKLLREGRLEDERIKLIYTAKKVKSTSSSSIIPTMKTHCRIKTKTLPATSKRRLKKLSKRGFLVWTSNALKERDLNIPTGSNTNPTGSMYFKRGALTGIDQRHYFKDIVFNGLTWIPDVAPSKRHLLRATADFEIIINGVSYGTHSLKLTHNSKTTTTTYAQNNAMTQIHWGNVKALVANRSLLGKIVNLYRKGNFYQLEIV